MKGKDTKWAESNVVEKEGKEYVELGKPLPGYTILRTPYPPSLHKMG